VTLAPEYGRGHPVDRRLSVSCEVYQGGAVIMPANRLASEYKGRQSFLVRVA
jgi:hypothetical protein